MGKNANKIKSEQLGMPFGTANNKLRKEILFMLVKECKRDICYRCKNKIDEINNFSIEHKNDWLYSMNPIENFFDLNNIAFSHLSCNSEAKRRKHTIQSKSGYKGVSYIDDGRRKKWRAIIYFNNKNNAIGSYYSDAEAAIAYDKKAKELFGEEAITNEKLGML